MKDAAPTTHNPQPEPVEPAPKSTPNPLSIATIASRQAAYYESLLIQAEKQLRRNGIAPAYDVHHLSLAHLNEH